MNTTANLPISLDVDDRRELASMVRRVVRRHTGNERELFEALDFEARNAPSALCRFVEEYRTTGAAVSMMHIADPGDQTIEFGSGSLNRFDSVLSEVAAMAYVVARLLGHPFAYGSQQGGRLVNAVTPRPEGIGIKNFNGANTAFGLHNEDAIHNRRPNWVILAGVRNNGHVPTFVSAVAPSDLRPTDWKALREPAYIQVANPSQGGSKLRQRLPHALVSGPVTRPTLRVNTCAMEPWQCATRAHFEAYEMLREALERNVEEIVVGPGDVAILNNDRVVHGRPAFSANFDGADRLLHRIIVRASLAELQTDLVPGTSNVLRRNEDLSEFRQED